MTLTGTEKQVAWAQEIIKGYEAVKRDLEDAVATLSDMTMTEKISMGDPLNPVETVTKVFAKNLQSKHVAARDVAIGFHLHDAAYEDRDAIRFHDYGAGRQGQIEAYKAAIQWVSDALEAETDAKFWINRRY